MTRTHHTGRRRRAAAAALGLGLGALALAGPASATPGKGGGGDDDPGAIYALTNAEAGNAVAVFARSADGSLGAPANVPTGGLGSGGGLGSQGAVVLDDDLLLAVNAGSDDVSVLKVGRNGPRVVDLEPSGGDRPVSVTVRDGLVYVLNAGGAGNVSGFRLHDNGNLVPLPRSTRALSADGSAPAQVEFAPDGETLVVTEKATNVIDGFPVRRNGRLGSPVVTPSNGQTPFGFAFDPRGRLVVSEAFGGAAGASALSSYSVARGGGLGLISGTVPTLQTAACWVAITGSGRYAYTTNTASNTVTGYSIARDGALARLDADGVTATTGAGPTDVALSRASRFLYTLDAAAGTLSGFRVGSDGSLAPIGTTSGLPTGSPVGLAAR